MGGGGAVRAVGRGQGWVGEGGKGGEGSGRRRELTC